MTDILNKTQDKAALVELLKSAGAEFTGDKCRCIFHDDKNPSAGVYRQGGHWRFNCFGCHISGDYFDIKARLENRPAGDLIRQGCNDTKPQRKASTAKTGKPERKPETLEAIRARLESIEGQYLYFDDKQDIAGLIIRYRKGGQKSFMPLVPAGNDLYTIGAMPAPRPLYCLHEIKDAETVIVCEGEKCTEALYQYGFAACTSAGGSNAASQTDWKPLRGKRVILWPDNDQPGQGYISQVIKELAGLDCELFQIDPARLGLKEKEDAADLIKQLETIHRQDTQAIKAGIQKALDTASPIDEAKAIESGFPDLMQLEDYKLPDFPLDVLPAEIKAYIESISKSFHVPADMPGSIALAVMASSIQGRYTVQARPGWTEETCIYVICLMKSGSRKSAVIKELTRPLFEFEAAEAERLKSVIQQNQTELDILKKQRANAIKAEDKAEAARIDQEIIDTPEIHAPRLIAENITSEKLALLMSQNAGRMAIFAAESVSLNIMAGRYSDGQPDVDVCLKGYTGEPLPYDRIGRESVNVPKAALSIGLAIQPAAVENMRHKQYLMEVGFLPRFAFCCPQPLEGAEPFETLDIDQQARDLFYYLVKMNLEQRHDKDIELTLTAEARQIFKGYYESFKNQPDGLQEWRQKKRGLSLRLAAVLAVYNDRNQIDRQAIEGGIELAEYFEQHSRAAFGIIEAAPEIRLAKRIINWIDRTESREFSKTDLWQSIKGGQLQKASTLDEPLNILIENGYIMPLQDTKTTPGRKSERYLVNPKAFKKGEKGETFL